MQETNSSINLPEFENLNEIIQLYNSCALTMNKQGLFNWNLDYPDLKTIKKDILSKELYIFHQNRIKGAITLTTNQPEQYENLSWMHIGSRFLVVRRLAVHPDFQGQGIAKKLISFSEGHAQTNGFASIRLDVYSLSAGAKNLYLNQGYRIIGEFRFPNNDNPFLAMEKLITRNNSKNST